MADPSGVKSKGTFLEFCETQEGSYTRVARVGDINPGGSNADEIDTTSHDSPGLSKENLGGDIDPGTVSFPVNWIASNNSHQTLITLHQNQSLYYWQMVCKDGSKWRCQATVQSFGPPQAPVTGIYKSSITLRVTGNWEFVAAS